MPLLILTFNVILMFLFCCACQLVVTPAYNQFVQYGNRGSILPFLTQFVVDLRFFSFLIPVLWSVLSFKIHKVIQKKKIEEQTQALLLYSLVTISCGFLLIIFFTLAGILPYLKIGSVL